MKIKLCSHVPSDCFSRCPKAVGIPLLWKMLCASNLLQVELYYIRDIIASFMYNYYPSSVYFLCGNTCRMPDSFVEWYLLLYFIALYLYRRIGCRHYCRIDVCCIFAQPIISITYANYNHGIMYALHHSNETQEVTS